MLLGDFKESLGPGLVGRPCLSLLFRTFQLLLPAAFPDVLYKVLL